uniref:P-selectin-like n=1 Tax=Ciona intestinalis TaxID=7719 RepID=UPI0005215B0E|nr:P-selectin-like [Ciona intestinalis]|eukprot:XP_009858194.1 P-selectin-like [Ciona intestinalis]
MRISTALVTLVAFVCTANALLCWECENARSNRGCRLNGRLRRCQRNQRACQTEIRRDPQGIRISKRCKQARACDNNFIQNPRSSWFPSQCSNQHGSVCRCCCDFDNCNTPTVACGTRPEPTCDRPQSIVNGDVTCFGNAALPVGEQCVFGCSTGYTMVGDATITCRLSTPTTAAFDRPPPTCTLTLSDDNFCLPEMSAPAFGAMNCSETNQLGSMCTFTCESGYYVAGSPSVTCGENELWSSPPPSCQRVKCLPQIIGLTNGQTSCTDSNFDRSECSFICDPGFVLDGSPESVCADDNDGDDTGEWTQPIPQCQPFVSSIRCNPVHVSPENGAVGCSDSNMAGSVCTFECDSGYAMEGSDTSTCQDDGDGDTEGLWSSPAPVCTRVTCLPQHINPVNGVVQCNDLNNIGSTCTFSCSPGYELNGTANSDCIGGGNNGVIGVWTSPAPTCQERGQCRDVQTLQNGNVTCTNGNFVNSQCTYECNEAELYELYPANNTLTTCMSSLAWDVEPPCCSKECPPFAAMDLVLILDSSSSVTMPNWRVMKNFVRSIITTFNFGEDSARMAVFRYNRGIDRRNQVLLRDHINNRAAFLEAFDRIPYNGFGTRTGQALRYAQNVILAQRWGNRPNVKDVLLTITDGRSQDDVATVSTELRAMGVATFVIGIAPENGAGLDNEQLLAMGGSPENTMLTTSGFSGLDTTFLNRLSDLICTNRCG